MSSGGDHTLEVVALKRLAFLISGGALLLLLNAAPVLADGGPHVTTINSGTAGISADSCAGCHRAHTAQAPLLLIEEEPAMCLTCHGTAGTGATTDVMNGIQYRVGASDVRGSAVLGALRAGGFEQARIGSGSATRLAYLSGGAVRQLPAVPVLGSGQDVTSTHMDIDSPVSGTAWGNGAIDSGVGGTTTLTCTGCHNPHGNGMYRILNPIPAAHGDGSTMTPATLAVNVQDAPLPAPGDQRNYTVMQKVGTEGNNASYLLYASDVVTGNYAETVGDYFHRRVPWNGTTTGTYSYDAPNGKPSTFGLEINKWCAQCHTRYLADGTASYETDSGDDIFTYRHGTQAGGQVSRGTACTTCHVAHGSNAVMTGDYSSDAEYPGGLTSSASSRLLKIDNRGTCQACHDPTGTVTAGTVINGPGPTVP
jgi:predicted CXXCH cytochrome family protein